MQGRVFLQSTPLPPPRPLTVPAVAKPHAGQWGLGHEDVGRPWAAVWLSGTGLKEALAEGSHGRPSTLVGCCALTAPPP